MKFGRSVITGKPGVGRRTWTKKKKKKKKKKTKKDNNKNLKLEQVTQALAGGLRSGDQQGVPGPPARM